MSDMDKRLVGQFKVVVRKSATTQDVNVEVVNYPVSTSFITTCLDDAPLDEVVDDVVNALLPSIRAAVRDLYERASKTT